MDEDGDGMNDCEELGCKDGEDNDNDDIKDCYESGCENLSYVRRREYNGWLQKIHNQLTTCKIECYMTFDHIRTSCYVWGTGENGNLSDLWIWNGESELGVYSITIDFQPIKSGSIFTTMS